jgi:hypothetical protein
MYGMVNRAIEQMVVSAHGPAVWENIKERAGVDVDIFISSEGYPDALTYNLVGAASAELGVPADQILEAFGVHWVVKTTQEGYSDMMSAGGKTLREFLLNLPNFHARLSMIFPHLAPPEFKVDDLGETSVRLHYFSGRPGLAPFVKGLMVGLGQSYNQRVIVEHNASKAEGADHDEFTINW